MKLGSVTKLDKKKKSSQETLIIILCWQVVMYLSLSQYMVNLEQSGTWILDP